MLKKRAALFLVLCLCATGLIYSQTRALSWLQAGVDLYGEGKWEEAVAQLSLIDQSAPVTIRAEALFWLAQAKLSGGDYRGALQDMQALEILDPANSRIGELGYHKGRALYYLGRYDEAIVLLMNYADSFKQDNLLSSQELSQKAAAFFWVGECLYAMGQFDRAEDIFFIITNDYPQSAKYEASVYRIALIGQKKIETELLSLLNWNHQESLVVMEEYQRREQAYEQAILSYQRRISEMMADNRMSVLEESNAQYQQELVYAQSRIRELEARLGEANASISADRLNNLRNTAVEIQNEIERSMNEAPASIGY